MDKSLGGAWKTKPPQSISAYPGQHLTLEIHTIRYYYSVPHALGKLLPYKKRRRRAPPPRAAAARRRRPPCIKISNKERARAAEAAMAVWGA